MQNYKTSIGVYDSITGVLIDTYTFASDARCKQINDRRAMSYAKDLYLNARIADLANQYGEVIYRLVDDGIINPLDKYVFEISDNKQNNNL